MRIMAAADIHGSAYYCKRLLEAYKAEKADKLLLLGDILYHGPRNDLPKDYNPKAVTSMLNEYKKEILCVRGNCDTEVDQMVLEFPILAESCVLFLNGQVIHATHGHKVDETYCALLQKGDMLLCGHTHVPAYEERDGYIYVNPGSVSIPKEGSKHGYIIIEQTVEYKTLS